MSENNQRTVLAIGAHPDDIEFGCGAILLKEAASGSKIHLLVCSKGESGSNGTPELRVEEATVAAGLIGASIEFLDFGGDAHIERTKVNELKLARAIREAQPGVVLAPSLVENQHPDHYVVGHLVRDAVRLARYAGVEELTHIAAHAVSSLLYYAITPGGEPKGDTPLLFDVSEELERWKELMGCHVSQMKTRDYLELQLTRARMLGLQMKCDYAQALFCEDGIIVSGLGELTRTARQF